ncbi:MAG: bifunctional lysylphosphatidylglycerol flippase/synthetase MprF [bacterium]
MEETHPSHNPISTDKKGYPFIRVRRTLSSALRTIIPVLSIILFIAALWVLHEKLAGYHYDEIMIIIKGLPALRIVFAFCLMIASYLLLTGYDSLSLYYIRHPIAYARIALTSFISYAFSHNIGLPMLSGGTVRYRLYSGWGLSAIEIGKVIIFNGLTFFLGFITVSGAMFLIKPIAIPSVLHLPLFTSIRPLGIVFLGTAAAYLLACGVNRGPFTIGRRVLTLPSPGTSLIQIALSSLDWMACGGILYILLPSHPALSFPKFLSIFMLAQFSGIVSQIPGGLGVFEAIILLLLSGTFPASVILGTLLVYRGIYYLFPLGVATMLLGTYELLVQKQRVTRFARFFGHWIPQIVPHILALGTFLSGVVLLFSGATPAAAHRLLVLSRFLPLPVLEISHFLGSLAGVGLILLAVSLERRIDAAYLLTAILLAAGIVLSMLKGFDYEVAIILAVMLVAILPCRRYFYRRASLISERFTPGWIAAISMALASAAWLGFFSVRHIEYSGQVWWQFALNADIPRILRTTVGAIGASLFFALFKLLSPAVPDKPAHPTPADLDRVRAVVKNSPKPAANLALLGDKTFLFSQSGKAFVMYGIEGRSWIALGDPVGPTRERADLAWEFYEMCERYGGWTVFYQVNDGSLPLYLDLGLDPIKIGEEARVPLASFSLEGSARGWLRDIHHTFDKEGYTFGIIPQQGIPPLLPSMKGISDLWLKGKNARERGFSLGFFNPEYLKECTAGIVRKGGDIVAFATIWPGAGMEECSVDLMRHAPDAPPGIMDYLLTGIMLWGKQEGYRWFNLGIAPLPGFEDKGIAPFRHRVGAFLFRHGGRFSDLQGLRHNKERFNPVWEPRYLACPGGAALPRILANIASLVSRGLKGAAAG